MTGAIILLSVLVPILIMVVIIYFMMRGQKANDDLLQRGIPARGRILQLGTTGMSVAVMGHRHLKLTFGVEVQPQAGPPYVANFEQLLSELQIPSVQPGAQVELRIDPQNPQRMAIASILPAQAPQQAWGQQAFGQQPGWGQQQAQAPGGWGAGPAQFGAAPIPVGAMTPNYKRAVPFMIFMMLITTVPVGLVMFFAFYDTGLWSFGGAGSERASSSDETVEDEDEAPKKKKKGSGGVCAQAAACCRVVSGDTQASCDNFEKMGMPVAGCEQSLEAFRKSAKAMKKSCD